MDRNEENIFIYDPVTHIKAVVSYDQLANNLREYSNYKVYVQLGNNPRVNDWLNENKEKYNE
jgi:hypothetical protein